jgi:ABC-type bacteriocin/lantibiotic exporter with double-glycine peptidase domain
MRFVQMKTVITACVVGFLVAAFAFAMKIRITDPKTSNEFAARQLGGTFLGLDGVVMQDRNNNCGPAALKMILEHYGKAVPLRDLENGVRAREEGWSMKALTEIAERNGIHATGWRLSANDLCERALPAILFVENRHFVVVDSADRVGFFYVRDPALGRLRLHRKALNKIWTGKALVFGENENPG